MVHFQDSAQSRTEIMLFAAQNGKATNRIAAAPKTFIIMSITALLIVFLFRHPRIASWETGQRLSVEASCGAQHGSNRAVASGLIKLVAGMALTGRTSPT